MGDIADFYIEQMLDRPHRSMFSRFETKPLKCRTCGADCYWAKRGGEWTLMEAGRAHKCREDDINAHALVGFESIE